MGGMHFGGSVFHKLTDDGGMVPGRGNRLRCGTCHIHGNAVLDVLNLNFQIIVVFAKFAKSRIPLANSKSGVQACFHLLDVFLKLRNDRRIAGGRFRGVALRSQFDGACDFFVLSKQVVNDRSRFLRHPPVATLSLTVMPFLPGAAVCNDGKADEEEEITEQVSHFLIVAGFPYSNTVKNYLRFRS